MRPCLLLKHSLVPGKCPYMTHVCSSSPLIIRNRSESVSCRFVRPQGKKDKWKTIGMGGTRVSFEHVDTIDPDTATKADDVAAITSSVNHQGPLLSMSKATHTQDRSMPASKDSAPRASRRNPPKQNWLVLDGLSW